MKEEVWYDNRNDILAVVFDTPDRFFPYRFIFWLDDFEYEKGCDESMLRRWGFIYIGDV